MNLRPSTMLRRRTSPMPNKPNSLVLAKFVPYRLSVLTNNVSSAIAKHYSDRFGLSIPEWRVMATLGGVSGLSAREVAARTAMDKVQVSRAIASLMATRRVQRSSDDKDGRITRLSLTRSGRKIYDEIVPLALDLEALLLSALTLKEQESFARLLSKLIHQAPQLNHASLPRPTKK